MARMTKEEKRIDNEANRCFKVHGNGVPINIFNLSKIHSAGVEAGRKGLNIEEAVKTAIQTYREN